MRNVLSLVSFVCLALLGAAVWMVMPSDAETMAGFEQEMAVERPEGFHLEGMLGGYLIPAEPLFLGEVELSSIMLESPVPDCDQPAMAQVFATIESEMTGWMHYQVSFLSVSDLGVEIQASATGEEDLVFVLDFDPAGLQAWLSGAESIELLGRATVTLGDDRVEQFPVSLWIGD